MKVTIQYDDWRAVLEVTPSEKTRALMKEQLLFWANGKKLIDEENGDIEKAYLKKLGKVLISISMEEDFEGIIAAFDEEDGWASLRGEYGVKLL